MPDQAPCDSRQTPRFRCSLDIVCRLRLRVNAADLTAVRVRNLSTMGVCLVLDRALEPRSTVHLELTHRWKKTVCYIAFRVVYTIRRCDGTFLVGGAFARSMSASEAGELLAHPIDQLETEEVGEAIVAKFPAYSRLNDEVIQSVDGQLKVIAAEWGNRPVILDFGRVTGLNSSMLRQLVTFNQQVAHACGRLALCSVAPEVNEVLYRTRLSSLLRVYRTEREALQAS